VRHVTLHHLSGDVVYLNPEHVLTVEYDGRGPGALIALAAQGRHWRDETTGETEPYRIATSETPDEVVLLLTGNA
jgi:hypothetical protein